MTAMRDLATVLRDPGAAEAFDGARWTAMLCVARAEVLDGTLAHRCADIAVPGPVAAMLTDIRSATSDATQRALWEAEMIRRALAPLGIPVVLLKGTAYAAAGLDPAPGRQIGDCDILVPHEALDAAEAALLTHGWEWVKQDEYDDAYYRQWMHELPPLVHADRDRMVDVHHTILPLTARPTPDADAMIADAVPAGDSGLSMLCPADMICHAAAHMIADGDLAGGLRNLWDIDRMLRQFSATDDAFWDALAVRADRHELRAAVERAVRLAHRIYATPAPSFWRKSHPVDVFFERHLMARNDWGQYTRRAERFGFYIRSHMLRMPLRQLLPHLATKWRKRHGGRAG